MVGRIGRAEAGSTTDTSCDRCLWGKPGNSSIEDQLTGRGHRPVDDYLAKWRVRTNSPEQNKCSVESLEARSYMSPHGLCETGKMVAPVSGGGSGLKDLAKVVGWNDPQRYVDHQCIVDAIPHMNTASRFYVCQPGTEKLTRLKNAPCVTPKYASYIHSTINRVIRCLAGPGDPIDVNLLVRQLTQENKFSNFSLGMDGRGIGQMTGPAMQEMNDELRGRAFILDRMQTNAKYCQEFESIVSVPLESSRQARDCQYVSMGDGVARNLLHSIGLYLYFRSGYGRGGASSAEGLLEARGFAGNPDFVKIRDYLTIVGYGRNGPSGMRRTLDKIMSNPAERLIEMEMRRLRESGSAKSVSRSLAIREFQKRTGINLGKGGKNQARDYFTNKMTFDEFKGLLDKRVGYLREIERGSNKVLGESRNCAVDPAAVSI